MENPIDKTKSDRALRSASITKDDHKSSLRRSQRLKSTSINDAKKRSLDLEFMAPNSKKRQDSLTSDKSTSSSKSSGNLSYNLRSKNNSIMVDLTKEESNEDKEKEKVSKPKPKNAEKEATEEPEAENDELDVPEHYLPLNATSVIDSRPGLKFPSNVTLPDIKFNTELSDIGGLDLQIERIRESFLLPLIYPDLFKKHKIQASRGILFHGPPGTGKTYLARALVHECSKDKLPVAYFHFTSANILSKWVGESESRLKKIFNAAKEWAPSIIYFDELDGLAPIRDENDYAGASLVSALLAEMDGFNSLGKVLVVGSTNRIDQLDPALRRPGRFDSELYFPLPDIKARKAILTNIISKWPTPIGEELIDKMAGSTNGYCSADIKSLCDKAVKFAFSRTHPDAFKCIDPNNDYQQKDLNIVESDFLISLKKITPVADHIVGMECHPISAPFDSLLNPFVNKLLEQINAYQSELNSYSQRTYNSNLPQVIVLKGKSNVVQINVLSATLNALEGNRIRTIDFAGLQKVDDLSGCKELNFMLNDCNKYNNKTTFVIRNLNMLNGYSPQLINILKNFMMAPIKSGAVTFIITSMDLNDINLLLAGVQGSIVSTDIADAKTRGAFFNSLISTLFKIQGTASSTPSESLNITDDPLQNLCIGNLMYATENLNTGEIIELTLELKLELVEPSYEKLAEHVKDTIEKFHKLKVNSTNFNYF